MLATKPTIAWQILGSQVQVLSVIHFTSLQASQGGKRRACLGTSAAPTPNPKVTYLPNLQMLSSLTCIQNIDLIRKPAMPLETYLAYPLLLSAPSYNIAQAPSMTKHMRFALKGPQPRYALSQAAIN
eukprot:115885-Pelagomonas_calceolata.AAC.2